MVEVKELGGKGKFGGFALCMKFSSETKIVGLWGSPESFLVCLTVFDYCNVVNIKTQKNELHACKNRKEVNNSDLTS